MASTFDQLLTEYHDNRDYDVEDSVAKAKAFIKACRGMLPYLGRHRNKDNAESQLSPQVIRQQLDDALAWWQANKNKSVDGGGVKHLDLSNFRE